MCPEWMNDPVAFVEYIGEPPTPEHTVDRIDNARGYEPGNVRWATLIEQANNKTNNRIVTYRGESMTLSQMIRARAADEGVPESTMRRRVERQFDDKCAAQNNARSVQVGGDHYSKLAIQPFDFITANNIGWAEGCAIKYLVRWRDKNGVQDLRKARHFIDMLIERET